MSVALSAIPSAMDLLLARLSGVKAIPTNYDGILFRSRLEARWAVFFNALGIDWRYEPEGFELADGTRYLPDFAVLNDNAYVEIKPAGDPFIKARTFAIECGKPVWLCAGEPTVRPWSSLSLCADDDGLTELVETEIVYHPWKRRVWLCPSAGETEDFLSDAATLTRSHRFWNPRRSA
jgi:hypothetical protein